MNGNRPPPPSKKRGRRPPGREQLARYIAERAASAGIKVDPALLPALAAQLELLYTWNERYSLTAIRDPEEGARRHVVEALEGLPFVPETGLLVDLGSGTGYPALPLFHFRPTLAGLLFEAREKKAAYLVAAVRESGFGTRVGVRNERVAGPSALPPGTTCVTLRGFPDPGPWVHGLLEREGPLRVLAWLSLLDAQAIAAAAIPPGRSACIHELRSHKGAAILVAE